MDIAVVGTGYVGLATGVALAYLGHRVFCIDIDKAKIETLRQGRSPIYEPGLEELVRLVRHRLEFTDNYAPIRQARVVFITVGTPSLPNGSPDLSQVEKAARAIGLHLGEEFTVIVNKSTVPIGSSNWVEGLIREAYRSRNGHSADGHFAVASNPEFLREGSALSDTLYPDRVVVGAEHPDALKTLYALYRPILEQTFPAPPFVPRPQGLRAVPFVATDLASAELIKYAANAFLALKISFINEIAALAEKVGADVTQVARGIGLDARIGTRFLEAGIGWGGSCFGKDTAALLATAREYGLAMPIVEAARHVNYRQRERVVEKLLEELKILKGKTIGLLGLSFKPQTDDLRDAPSLDIARQLRLRGAWVKAHDPVAVARARRERPDLEVHYCDRAEEVFDRADAVVLATEWPEYRSLPWEQLASVMRFPLVFDGRNFLDAERLARAGFRHLRVGVGTVAPVPVHSRVPGAG